MNGFRTRTFYRVTLREDGRMDEVIHLIADTILDATAMAGAISNKEIVRVELAGFVWEETEPCV